MRTPKELIKEVVDEINSGYEGNAKSSIRTIINDICHQQRAIEVAKNRIVELQKVLKEISVDVLPANILI